MRITHFDIVMVSLSSESSKCSSIDSPSRQEIITATFLSLVDSKNVFYIPWYLLGRYQSRIVRSKYESRVTSHAHHNDTLWIVIDHNNSRCVFHCCIVDFLFKLASSTKYNCNFPVIISYEIGFTASIHNFIIRLPKYHKNIR